MVMWQKVFEKHICFLFDILKVSTWNRFQQDRRNFFTFLTCFLDSGLGWVKVLQNFIDLKCIWIVTPANWQRHNHIISYWNVNPGTKLHRNFVCFLLINDWWCTQTHDAKKLRAKIWIRHFQLEGVAFPNSFYPRAICSTSLWQKMESSRGTWWIVMTHP